uniref:C-type lectin domain-containing protein n=1 Tax=Syphacia muris TaxID=451379 RepID=A0A0N5AZT1_9BILA
MHDFSKKNCLEWEGNDQEKQRYSNTRYMVFYIVFIMVLLNVLVCLVCVLLQTDNESPNRYLPFGRRYYDDYLAISQRIDRIVNRTVAGIMSCRKFETVQTPTLLRTFPTKVVKKTKSDHSVRHSNAWTNESYHKSTRNAALPVTTKQSYRQSKDFCGGVYIPSHLVEANEMRELKTIYEHFEMRPPMAIAVAHFNEYEKFSNEFDSEYFFQRSLLHIQTKGLCPVFDGDYFFEKNRPQEAVNLGIHLSKDRFFDDAPIWYIKRRLRVIKYDESLDCVAMLRSNRVSLNKTCPPALSYKYYIRQPPYYVQEQSGHDAYCLYDITLDNKVKFNYTETQQYCSAAFSGDVLTVNNYDEHMFLADLLFQPYAKSRMKKGLEVIPLLRFFHTLGAYAYDKAIVSKYYLSHNPQKDCMVLVRNHKQIKDDIWFSKCTDRFQRIVCKVSLRTMPTNPDMFVFGNGESFKRHSFRPLLPYNPAITSVNGLLIYDQDSDNSISSWMICVIGGLIVIILNLILFIGLSQRQYNQLARYRFYDANDVQQCQYDRAMSTSDFVVPLQSQQMFPSSMSFSTDYRPPPAVPEQKPIQPPQDLSNEVYESLDQEAEKNAPDIAADDIYSNIDAQ